MLTLPEAQPDLLAHEDWIKEETLALEIALDGSSTEPTIVRVS